jgi:predicted ester cyclase
MRSSSGTPSVRHHDEVSSDELREWYAEYLDACNRHDLTELRALIAPDVRRAHLPGGVGAWIADFEALFAAFPDLQWKRINVLGEGDRIASHLRVGGTHRGAFRGVAPTGRHVNVAEFGMYRIVGGRIAEYAGTGDGADLLRQLT